MSTPPLSHLIFGSLACDSPAFAELSREILGAGKSLRFQARGASMAPLVRDGDTLTVEPVAAAQLGVGDLALFCREPGAVVVHRVVRVEAGAQGRRFLMQGDAVAHPDGLFAEGDIHGRVTALERGGARLELARPAMRLLGWLAVLRSRHHLRHGALLRLAGWLIKRLPPFSRYLAEGAGSPRR